MQCPKCSKFSSQSLSAGVLQADDLRFDIPIEYCQRCKGVCLQQDQLQALLGMLSAKEKLLIPKDADKLENVKCPNCAQDFYEFCYPDTKVLMSMCNNCTYLWLGNDEYQTLLRPIQGDVKHGEGRSRKYCPSYADGIPGIKGRLLRYIDRTMSQLQNSLF